MEGERGCSVVPIIIVRCREFRRRGGHKRAAEEVSRLCHHECVCVLLQSHPSSSLFLSLVLCISQAHTTDYIMRPHPCAAVEQNKGTLPAETQQPRRMRRGQSVCLCACLWQRGRQSRERGVWPCKRPRQQKSGRLFSGNNTGMMFIWTERIPKLPSVLPWLNLATSSSKWLCYCKSIWDNKCLF